MDKSDDDWKELARLVVGKWVRLRDAPKSRKRQVLAFTIDRRQPVPVLLTLSAAQRGGVHSADVDGYG